MGTGISRGGRDTWPQGFAGLACKALLTQAAFASKLSARAICHMRE